MPTKIAAGKIVARTTTGTAALLALICAPGASAQWVTFTDETTTSLQLSPFNDAPKSDPLLDAEEKDIAVADFNKDGWVDVIAVRKQPFSNPGAKQDVLLMNESGTLVDRTTLYAPGFLVTNTDARDVVVTDIDQDGWDDIVIANTFEQQPVLYRNAGLDEFGEWQGLVDESAQRLPFLTVPTDVSTVQFCAVAAADITDDNYPELYFANYVPVGATTDVLLENDGTGHFFIATQPRLGEYANVAFGTNTEFHDVDNDGDRDIVKISTLYEAPPFEIGQYILYNDGNGVFNNLPFQLIPSDRPYMYGVHDFNNDGLLDQYIVDDLQDKLAIAQSVTPDTVVDFVTTELAVSPRTVSFGGNLHVADLDSDGDLDMGLSPIDVDIANCGDSELFALLRNNGDGTLEDPWPDEENQNFHLDPHDFAFLDVNGDSCPDLFMGLCTGWSLMINDCPQPTSAPLNAATVLQGEMVVSPGQLWSPVQAVEASDDSWLQVDSITNTAGSEMQSATLFAAVCPFRNVSEFRVALESRADAPQVSTSLQVFNFERNGWDVLDEFELPVSDEVRTYGEVTQANAYLRRPDGAIVLRLITRAPKKQVPMGYQVFIDRLGLSVVD